MRRRPVLAGLAAALAAPAVARAQGRVLRIGYLDQADWLLFVARELRLFEREGLAPEFVRFESGPPIIEAAQADRIDLASIGSAGFLAGLSLGLDWTMIGINPEGAYSQGLVARRDGPVVRPVDLKGRRVALTRGGTAEVGLLMILRQHGIRPDQMTLVDMTPGSQVAALAENRIDAAMTWEPWMQRMIHEAQGRIVETEGNLGIYTNVDCYSVRRSWLALHRDLALRFLRALVAAADLVNRDPGQARRIWAQALGIKLSWAEAIYDNVPPPLIREWTNPRYTYSLVKGGELYQRLGFLAHYMREVKLISKPADLEGAMDSSLIAEILRGRR
ncbi:MAG: ABC transporter substrate-binding protein [Proteobacteria bacterium]|nr:ABC transporter substrate-binding protein [Pseudomonadota bacterium]